MPPEAEEKKEVEKPKSSKKMLFIILPVVLLLLGGGGAFAYFKFFKGGDEAGAAAKKADEQSVVQEMDTFMVNLADAGGRRFLKVTMRAKLNSSQLSDEFKARSFEMRDVVLTILTSKESEDVAKPEDKSNLKKEIIASLNKILRKGQVLDIYFTEFLIQ